MTIEERIQEMAEKYACGIGRSDRFGIASFPDTHEMKAYITAARLFYKMGWDDRGVEDKRICMDGVETYRDLQIKGREAGDTQSALVHLCENEAQDDLKRIVGQAIVMENVE